MKHNTKITLILTTMFLITQLIGLFVIGFYNQEGNNLPYGMEPPQEIKQETSIISILFAFAIAITLFLILTKIKAERFIRAWFFAITVIAIGLTISVIFFKLDLAHASFVSLVIAFPLAYIKIFKRNLLVHNLTELLIYPGIAAVFVPILGVIGIIILLSIISVYDIWAVWHSGFMQKMAKYQINKLKFFTGFFVPYAEKKQRDKINLIKQKYKTEKALEKHFKKAKIKIHLAILGGGDIIFPIITAGVFYKVYSSIFPAFIITISATIALIGLFILARKGKFYPAMPFLTTGMYLGMIVNWIVF